MPGPRPGRKRITRRSGAAVSSPPDEAFPAGRRPVGGLFALLAPVRAGAAPAKKKKPTATPTATPTPRAAPEGGRFGRRLGAGEARRRGRGGERRAGLPDRRRDADRGLAPDREPGPHSLGRRPGRADRAPDPPGPASRPRPRRREQAPSALRRGGEARVPGRTRAGFSRQFRCEVRTSSREPTAARRRRRARRPALP